jgi:hypothetical protein
MPVHGAPLRPQAMFFGFAPDDADFIAMSKLVARAELVDADSEFQNHYHLPEWDVAVVKGEPDADRPAVRALPEHMDLLALGGAGSGWVRTTDPQSGDVGYTFRGEQVSPTVTVADDLEQPVHGLVTRELVPWLLDQPSRPYLVETITSGHSAQVRVASGHPWVTAANGATVAGLFLRGHGLAEGGLAWVAPFVPARPEAWLGAALESWAARRPERYSDLPRWELDPRWQTPSEIEATMALQALAEERERIVRELDEREGSLRADLVSAKRAAELGARRLLNAQGDQLVEAVAEALRSLGFSVVDVDATLDGARRVEDLRVSEPADPGWTNITEVKGYSGGARSSDLQRLSNYAELYRTRTERLPDTRWYVVNHALTDPPAGRTEVLAGADDHVDLFAEVGGLVIDTRILFSLVRDVELGLREAETVRQHMRQGTGRLILGTT